MVRAHNFSTKQRKAIAKRANGICEKCHAVLKVGEGEADHVIPVELGGESEIDNGQWLCRVCHRGKTTLDVKTIRKAQRLEASRLGVKKRTTIRKAPPGTRYEQGPYGLRAVRENA